MDLSIAWSPGSLEGKEVRSDTSEAKRWLFFFLSVLQFVKLCMFQGSAPCCELSALRSKKLPIVRRAET